MVAGLSFVPAGRHPGERWVASAIEQAGASLGRVTGSRRCTGSLVLNPRIVVTAAHCVVAADDTLVPGDIQFRPYHGAGADETTFRGHVVLVGSPHQWAGHTVGDESGDWAIIVLDSAPPRMRALDLRPLGGGEQSAVGGHGSWPAYAFRITDAKVVVAGGECSIVDVRWGGLLHDCVMSPGSSGAPLLVESGDGVAIVGIMTALLRVTGEAGRDAPAVTAGAAVGFHSFAAAVLATADTLTVEGGSRPPAPPSRPRQCFGMYKLQVMK